MSAKRKVIMSDLNRLDKMKDSEIDYSDIPALDESFFTKEIITPPKTKNNKTFEIWFT